MSRLQQLQAQLDMLKKKSVQKTNKDLSGQDHAAEEGSVNLEQGNTTQYTDIRTWQDEIKSKGNRPEEWLSYTNFLVSQGSFPDAEKRFNYIVNQYGEAIKCIPYELSRKNEAYARLVVNYANFRVENEEIEDARDLFTFARTNARYFAIVHVSAAQFELQQGNSAKCRKILEKGRDLKATPAELLKHAHRNFVMNQQPLFTEEDVRRCTAAQADMTGEMKSGQFNTANLLQNRRSDTDTIQESNHTWPANITTPKPKVLSVHKEPKEQPVATPACRSSILDDSNPIPPTVSVRRPPKGNHSDSFKPPHSQAIKVTPATGSEMKSASPDTEGTISFNLPGKPPTRVRNSSGSSCTEGDTVAVSFDAHQGVYARSLKTSHSTPDCKNPGLLSGLNSNQKRKWTGKARRVVRSSLPQLNEEEDVKSELNFDLVPMPETPVHKQCHPGIEPLGSVLTGTSTIEGDSGIHETSIERPAQAEQSMETSPDLPTDNRTRTQTMDTQPAVSKSFNSSSMTESETLRATQKASVVPAETSQRSPAPIRPQPVLPTPQHHLPSHPQQSLMTPGSWMSGMPVAYPADYPMGFPYTPAAQPKNMLIVNGQAYTTLNVIGRGGTSKVYQVLDSSSNMKAVKVVNMEDADEPTVASYLNEIHLLQRLQHSDRVIRMYDHEYNQEQNKLYVVMERGDVDLSTLFRQATKKGEITDIEQKFYWKQMLEAVNVLHKEGIVHSDLKPSNYLLVSGRLKLIDFGIAKAIQADMTSVTRDQQVGTLNYMSPEAIMDTCGGTQTDENGRVIPRIKLGVKSDVWSLGCILYNMVYGRTPFQHITNQFAKLQAIINMTQAIKFPDLPDKHLLHVLKNCLQRNPKDRPSIAELMSHPYLIGVQKEITPAAPEGKKVSTPLASDKTRDLLMAQLASANVGSPVAKGIADLLQGHVDAGTMKQLNQLFKKQSTEPDHPVKRKPLQLLNPQGHPS